MRIAASVVATKCQYLGGGGLPPSLNHFPLEESPPTREQNDTRLYKRYLPSTSLAGCKYVYFIVLNVWIVLLIVKENPLLVVTTDDLSKWKFFVLQLWIPFYSRVKLYLM